PSSALCPYTTFVRSYTGIPVENLQLAAEKLGTTKSLVTTTLQGTYQSADATTACVAINNLHLIRGLIGKPGSGPLHMAGQPSSSDRKSTRLNSSHVS